MDVASEAVAGGVKFIQYRAKGLDRRKAYHHARELRVLAHRFGVVLLINDEVDLAMAIEADGVHLGQEDFPLSAARALLGPKRIIGISAHTQSQAREAEAGGADYLGVGPIFSSTTKQERPPLGCDALKQIRNQIHIPVIAIGGISTLNVRQVMETGVDGVAVVSAILSRSDVKRATMELMTLLRSFATV